jgi:hypothetical protein
MEGSIMGQICHGSATTTRSVRAAIQRSQASLAQLSRELGINPKTVTKWRKRETVEDRKTGLVRAVCNLGEVAAHMGWSLQHAAAMLERYAALDPEMTDGNLEKVRRAEDGNVK